MFTPVLELRCLSVDELASVCLQGWVCVFSLVSFDLACVSHITLPWVRGTSFTQRRSKRCRQSTSRFRPLCLWHEEMGLNLMGVWFFPCTAFYLPKLWIIIITHQVNRQHQCTDCTGQQLRDRECRERDHGKNGFLTGEWQMRWASDALT